MTSPSKLFSRVLAASLCCAFLFLQFTPPCAAQESNDQMTDTLDTSPAQQSQQDGQALVQPNVDDGVASTNPAAVSGAESTEKDFDSDPGSSGFSNRELVSYGKDILLKSNETAEVIVVIGGSAKVEGKVRDAIVAIGGSIEISGEAQSAVAIFGSIKMKPGARLNESVAVAGNVRVANGAETGEAVAVGGTVDVAEGGIVRGEKISLGMPGFAAPEWLQEWFRECVMKLRPLAPQVGWIWAIAGVFFLLYLFVGLVFQAPVKACVDELSDRPASTLLVGLLTMLLLPVVIVILLATGIGAIVVPFLLVAVAVMKLFGRVAILQGIGVGLGRAVGATVLQKPLLALLVGGIVLALLYMVPVLGLIVFILSGIWGLGAVVMAMAGRIKRERPRKPMAPPARQWPNAPVGAFAGTSSGAAAPGAEAGNAPVSSFAGSQVAEGEEPSSPPVFTSGMPEPAEAMTYPFATFWQRMGAAFLDVILVSILGSFVGGPPFGFLVALAYFSGMWAWKGTTVGGIVLGLKVVRVDGQPLSFAAALVRGLAAAFSVVVLFLGFFWIAWDREKQGWHDKIAGTVVVKLPRGTPLV